MNIDKFPPLPYKRFSSFGLGFIVSKDNDLQGVAVLLGFWQLKLFTSEAALVLAFLVMILIIKVLV
jgi:hypothetical protein